MYEVKHASKLIASNTAVQIIGRIFFLALSLINFKLIANYLGPNLFGDFGNVFNYTAMFTVITDFGLFTVAVREIAKYPKKKQLIMENVLSLRIVLALVATALAIGVSYLIAYAFPESGYHNILTAIQVGSFAMLIYFVSNMLDVVFHVELKMHFIALVELIGKIVAVIAVVIAIWLKADFLWIVSSVALGNLAGMIARFITARRFFTFRLRFDWPTWRWLLGMAIPLGVVFALNNLYFKVDGIMLYIMKGSFDNGIYTAAYRVLETTVFASAFFVQAMTPYLSNYLEHKPEKAKTIIATGSEILLAMGAILATAIIFYSKEVILLLSGPEYLAAAIPLSMLALVATMLYVNSLLGQVLVLKDLRKILLTVSFLTLLFNVILNLYLIPKFSFVGTAAATLVTEAMLLGGNYLILRSANLFTIRTANIIKIFTALIIAIVLFSLAKYIGLYWIIPFFAVPALFFLLLWKQHIIPLNILWRKEA